MDPIILLAVLVALALGAAADAAFRKMVRSRGLRDAEDEVRRIREDAERDHMQLREVPTPGLGSLT